VGFEDNIGIKIGGRTINILRYADDTTTLTEDKEDMRKTTKKAKGRE
jgi:hypothetical protein